MSFLYPIEQCLELAPGFTSCSSFLPITTLGCSGALRTATDMGDPDQVLYPVLAQPWIWWALGE